MVSLKLQQLLLALPSSATSGSFPMQNSRSSRTDGCCTPRGVFLCKSPCFVNGTVVEFFERDVLTPGFGVGGEGDIFLDYSIRNTRTSSTETEVYARLPAPECDRWTGATMVRSDVASGKQMVLEDLFFSENCSTFTKIVKRQSLSGPDCRMKCQRDKALYRRAVAPAAPSRMRAQVPPTAACSIVGTWCDIEGRCSNAPITITGNTSEGCSAHPSRWHLRAFVNGRPHFGPLCQGTDTTGKLFAQVQLGNTIVQGDIDRECGSIFWRNDSAFSTQGWCRVGTRVDGKSCSQTPSPVSPDRLPVDNITFRVDASAKAKNLSKDFWDNESWQPSNYPPTRFILEAGDALLKLLPFHQPASPSAATSALDGPQVAGITNIVRILGGWGTSSWCGRKNGGAWSPPQTEPCDAYDLVYRDNSTGALYYRWHLLHSRVEPVLRAGSTPEIGLGNVPYAFVQHASQATYGQCQPPDDIGEWVVFIVAFVRELVGKYGPRTVSRWRFRIGTEENAWNGKIGIAHLCWHNVTEFLELYDHTAAAILKVLPTAQV